MKNQIEFLAIKVQLSNHNEVISSLTAFEGVLNVVSVCDCADY